MTITLTQKDYWDLVHASQRSSQSHAVESFDTLVPYPAQLGQGHYRFIDLHEGVELLIGHFQLHDDVVMMMPERSHPIEYGFYLAGKSHHPQSMATGNYCLYGSGAAPQETWGDLADEPIWEVNVHLKPSVFQAFLGESFDLASAGLAHLMRPAEQLYYGRFGSTTVAMQTALHQLLHLTSNAFTKLETFLHASSTTLPPCLI